MSKPIAVELLAVGLLLDLRSPPCGMDDVNGSRGRDDASSGISTPSFASSRPRPRPRRPARSDEPRSRPRSSDAPTTLAVLDDVHRRSTSRHRDASPRRSYGRGTAMAVKRPVTGSTKPAVGAPTRRSRALPGPGCPGTTSRISSQVDDAGARRCPSPTNIATLLRRMRRDDLGLLRIRRSSETPSALEADRSSGARLEPGVLAQGVAGHRRRPRGRRSAGAGWRPLRPDEPEPMSSGARTGPRGTRRGSVRWAAFGGRWTCP